MELMNWLCPECGLSLSKHLIGIDCPVSDVDEIDASDEWPCRRLLGGTGISVIYMSKCSYCAAGLPSTATEFRQTCPNCGRQV